MIPFRLALGLINHAKSMGRYVIIVLFLASVVLPARGSETLDWQRLISEEMQVRCDSQLAKYSASSDSSRLSEVVGIRLNDTKYISVHGQQYFVVLLGCLGYGEIIFLDSMSKEHEYMRKSFQMPDRAVTFNEIKDLDGDGNPEIQLGLIGGNRGSHLYFLSVFPDSLSFIRNSKGSYDFYAMSGYEVSDSDSDGVFDIKISGYVPQGKKENFIVYRFSKQRAVEVQKVEK